MPSYLITSYENSPHPDFDYVAVPPLPLGEGVGVSDLVFIYGGVSANPHGRFAGSIDSGATHLRGCVECHSERSEESGVVENNSSPDASSLRSSA